MDGRPSSRLWRDSGEDLWSFFACLSDLGIGEDGLLRVVYRFILLCLGRVRGSFLIDWGGNRMLEWSWASYSITLIAQVNTAIKAPLYTCDEQ